MKKSSFEDLNETIEFHDAGDKSADVRDLRILALEDDFGDFDDLCRALQKMTAFRSHVSCARNLEEARRATSSGKFDVALVDYCLGHESGTRFLQENGGRTGPIVGILLTGQLSNLPQEAAISAGAIGCINKDDLSPRLLETTIRYAMHTHRLELEMDAVVQRMLDGKEEPQQYEATATAC